MRKHSTPEETVSAFWKFVKKLDGDGCWLFAGARNNEGYGIFRHQYAHRFAWYINHGEIPEGYYICHKCDCPWCVRVDHLFLGSPSDNSQDMYRKKRYPKQRPYHHDAYAHLAGEGSKSAKLSNDQVAAIRQRFAQGETNLSALSREYGVSPNAIKKVVTGKTWRHLLSN